jgi:hypothetical protein
MDSIMDRSLHEGPYCSLKPSFPDGSDPSLEVACSSFDIISGCFFDSSSDCYFDSGSGCSLEVTDRSFSNSDRLLVFSFTAVLAAATSNDAFVFFLVLNILLG